MSVVYGDILKDQWERLISPTMWSVATTAGAAAQATAVKGAGGAGQKHVCYGIIATLAAGATAQTPIEIQVLDGASVILRAQVSAPVDGVGAVTLVGLHLIGTAATSMTLQFAGAGAAATIQSVTLIGYDVD